MALRYRFLTSRQVRRLYISRLFATEPTQLGLLDFAVSSPINNKNYGQEDLIVLAAILSERIVKNHAYQDGNKRIALLAADMFLKINGFMLQVTPMGADPNNDNIAQAHVKVVTGAWSSTELASFYQSIVAPLAEPGPEVTAYRNEVEWH